MKQLLLLSFALALLAGCKKSSDPPPFRSYLRMTIDGTRKIIADQIIRASNPRSTTTLFVYGTWSNGSLSIDLYYPTLGERIVTSATSLRFLLSDSTQFYAGDNGILGGVNGSGKINMLEINDVYVKGTFEFIGVHHSFTRTRTVTGGQFHIKREP